MADDLASGAISSATNFATTSDGFELFRTRIESGDSRKLKRRVDNKRHTSAHLPWPPTHQMGIQSLLLRHLTGVRPGDMGDTTYQDNFRRFISCWPAEASKRNPRGRGFPVVFAGEMVRLTWCSWDWERTGIQDLERLPSAAV